MKLRIVSEDGLSIWARLAARYDDRRGHLAPFWRSVTELLDSPHVAALRSAHKDDVVEVDALYLLRSVEGTALHDALSSVAAENELVGHRIYHTVQPENVVISGEPDLILLHEDGSATIVDFKRVKAAIAIYADSLEKYEWQVRLYSYLVKKEMGIQSIDMQLHLRFSDWHERDAKADSRYPQKALLVHKVAPVSDAECEEFLHERVRAHLAAERDPDKSECSESERWARGGYWCVLSDSGRMKPGSRSDTEAEAAAYAAARGGRVVYRPGRSARCSPHGDYGGCLVRKWCRQYKEKILPMEALGFKEEEL